ncbi:MAG TPA: 50S ribosomal protein L10, partial [Verrucomicrobiales bacterium]|nr:50S ribosomal protein L10 [Verrucomicrobiales bacterium]
MKELKKVAIDDILRSINDSPYLLVVDYSGLKVSQFQELRKRLKATNARLQVAKNSFVKRAADSAEYPAELADSLVGQTAIVTGETDVCATAKVLKTFNKESKK